MEAEPRLSQDVLSKLASHPCFLSNLICFILSDFYGLLRPNDLTIALYSHCVR
jgi:cytoplasmic iron level regulating protein YaaA (DUF328/UPF0246 family)